MRYVETFGKTRDEAIDKAAMELGIPTELLRIEILEEGTKGFLGFGAKDFKIKASPIEDAVEEETIEEVIVEKVAPAKEESATEPVFKEKAEAGQEKSPEKPSSFEINPDTEKNVRKLIQDILDVLKLEAEINIVQQGEILKVSVIGEDAGNLIGRRGESLDALQMLLGLVANKTQEGYVKLQLDIENYREKREESLVRYANKMARMAAKQRRNIRLEPMNPNERRIIHSALQTDTYVTTYSEGEEPYRKVVIAYKR